MLIMKMIDKFDDFIKKRPKKTLVTVLIIVVTSSFLTLFRSCVNQTYLDIDSPIESSFQFLKQKKHFHGQTVTIFLNETGCPDCERVEKEIVPTIQYERLKGKKIIVLDVAKMNPTQIIWIKDNFKPVLIDHKYLSMPSVFEITYNSKAQKWKVNVFEKYGDLEKMLQILKR